MTNTLEAVEVVRKPIKALSVEVTTANMKDVAEWVSGEILEDKIGPHVKVKVHRPLNERQTRAYVGDVVLLVNTSFKVYNSAAFKKSFTRTSGGTVMVDTSKKVKQTDDANEGEIVRVLEGDVIVPKRIPAKKPAKKSA